MIGIAFYLWFLVLGFMLSKLLFPKQDIYSDILSGGVSGNLLLMCGIIPFSCVFGFGILSHILLFSVSSFVIIFLFVRKKHSFIILLDKPLLLTVIPITILIWVLLVNHIMVPVDGGIASGQSTYGDLAMHMGFITSVAEQGVFPPHYNLLSGTRLSYPFLADTLSSSLYVFGAGLRLAILIPSFSLTLLTVLGFFKLAAEFTKSSISAILSTVLFFFCGGFGFCYFLDLSTSDPEIFTRIFTGYYTTPTNFNEHNIRWSNTICDMLIPQRTTMAGWCVIIFALILLIRARRDNSRKLFITLGVIGGCMPMLHTHSFLALAIISLVLMLFDCTSKEKLVNWVMFGTIAAVLSVPQLMFWTFNQVAGSSSFLKFKFNWVNTQDNYFWFYLKNWGIAFILLIPAVANAGKENKKLLAAAAVVMLVAEFVQFQPNPYDNNKLIYITYMILIIAIGDVIIKIYNELHGIRGCSVIIAVIIFLGTFSGVLTVIREYISGGQYTTFSDRELEFADYVRTSTAKDAVFLTGRQHLNPICVLAGRNIYLGSDLYVYFHGFSDEIQMRDSVVHKIYEGSNPDEIKNLCHTAGIDYIFIGPHERKDYSINENVFSSFEKEAFSDFILYKIQ